MKKRKMFSRITALVLSAVMLIPLSAVSVFAEDTAQAVTLAEMNGLSLEGKKNGMAYLSTIAYKEAKGSVMYPLGENASLYWTLSKNLGELSAGTLKVRFYSEDVGAECALVFRNSTEQNDYGWKRITVNHSGWQEISISSSEDWFKKAMTGKADQIVFNGKGFDLGDKYKGKAIYLDSVWYEPTGTEYAQSNISSENKDIEIAKTPAERSSNSINKNQKYTADWTYTTNTRDGGDSAFTMLYIPDTKQYNFNLTGGMNTTDCKNADTVVGSGYNWLNMWVWSPAPQSGGFGIIPITNGSWNQSADRAVRTVDWSGWKLASFDISGLTDIKSINVNFNGFVGTKMNAGYTYSLTDNVLSQNSGTENCLVGPWQRWTNGGYIGFENIWLSKEKPAAQEQTSSSSTKVIEPLEGDTVLVDADKAPIKGCTVTADNSRIYGKAYRSQDIKSTYINASNKIIVGTTSGMYFATTPSEYTKDNCAETYTTGIKSNNYLNFWMYLPSPQYDQFGNYSEYNLCVTRMRSVDGANTKAFGIIANWSGWKLISVKLSDGGVNATDYLGDIYISANGYRNTNWKNGNEDSNVTYDNYTYNLAQENSKIDLAGSVDYRGSGYNTFYDVADVGRFDIERVWLSSEKPQTSFAGSIALDENQQTVNRDITAREVKFVSSDTEIAYVDDTTCNADLLVKTVDAENKKLISGSFEKDLELSGAYTVALPTLTDTAGNKYTGQSVWQMNAQGLHAYIDSENNKLTVKVSKAVYELNSDATLICAFFDTEGTTLENVELVSYDEAVGGYAIDYARYKTANNTAKYMMWADGMRPLIVSNSIY